MAQADRTLGTASRGRRRNASRGNQRKDAWAGAGVFGELRRVEITCYLQQIDELVGLDGPLRGGQT